CSWIGAWFSCAPRLTKPTATRRHPSPGFSPAKDLAHRQSSGIREVYEPGNQVPADSHGILHGLKDVQNDARSGIRVRTQINRRRIPRQDLFYRSQAELLRPE